MTIGVILELGFIAIVGLLLLIVYVGGIIEWNIVNVGSTGIYYDNHDGWHSIILNITVIEKTKKYMIIGYSDDRKETITRHDYIFGGKCFKWDLKYNLK